MTGGGNHLADILRAGAAAGDRVFAHLPDGGSLSHGALWQRAGRMAGALVAAGLAPGDRVAVQAEKSIAFIELYLGTILAGGVFLPLNTAYTPAEMAHFLNDAEPAVLVTDPARAADLGALTGARLFTLDAAGGGTLAEAAAAAAPVAAVSRAPDDLAAILYTSGTTGRSKGAMLTHGNLASNALTLRDVWGFTAEDVLIHALPVYHTHGLFVATNVALAAGCALRFHPRFDAGMVLADLPRATVLMGVPTFYVRLLEAPGLDRAACAGMRLFISGSAPLLPETHRRWQERTGHAILERYGMTETGMNTSNPLHGERRPGTVGFPLPGVELRIGDGSRPASPGEIGVIEVRGPNVFKGYWRMPEKTAEELRPDGWFITGDLGMIDADGYVHIVGRAKDLIISGGLNVYPREVEAAIDALPGGGGKRGVRPAPSRSGRGGWPRAIVAEPGVELSADSLRRALDGRLARFKLPAPRRAGRFAAAQRHGQGAEGAAARRPLPTPSRGRADAVLADHRGG
ncbi:MAG: malonyl-CoA synthase [Paracoccaceae bacterium]|nr:MAG: malonyl-CoA synthase [Paracoccaceae bacterium]